MTLTCLNCANQQDADPTRDGESCNNCGSIELRATDFMNHSVTCAICGELADERETVDLNPERQYESSPTWFEGIGQVFVAREAFGEGEAHPDCVHDNLREYLR